MLFRSDEVHEIYRGWRALAESYDRPRALIGEVWLDKPDRLAAYLRPDEMHTAFNFDYLNSGWDANALRTVIDATLDAHAPVDAPATWVLSNHDVTRHVTRYGRADTTYGMATRQHGTPTDLALGTRRARAALLLNLALPGSSYLDQGEELGLWEVEDIPVELRDDPIYHRSNGADIGRDGCRVPLPWSGTQAPFGFSPDTATAAPWLPQPADWAKHTVSALAADPDSILRFYRTALAARRAEPSLDHEPLTWHSTTDAAALHFHRGNDFSCLVNLGKASVTLPEHSRIVLASAPLPALPTVLLPDTAVWLHHWPAVSAARPGR